MLDDVGCIILSDCNEYLLLHKLSWKRYIVVRHKDVAVAACKSHQSPQVFLVRTLCDLA